MHIEFIEHPTFENEFIIDISNFCYRTRVAVDMALDPKERLAKIIKAVSAEVGILVQRKLEVELAISSKVRRATSD